MSGEFDIVAACKTIGRAIYVYNNNYNVKVICKYGADEAMQDPHLDVQYTSIGVDVEHYDCLR